MCVPIYPNETHPTGRAPVHTKPAFPFSNCYHWAFYDVDVRVRATQDGWNSEGGVRLPPKDEISMEMCWASDLEDAVRAQEKGKRRDEGEGTFVMNLVNGYNLIYSCYCGIIENGSRLSTSIEESNTDSASSVCSSNSEDVDSDLLPFGGKPMSGHEAELLPLVNLSYDLSAQLKEEEIPHPADLLEEIQQIRR